jgi:hypothetical protein
MEPTLSSFHISSLSPYIIRYDAMIYSAASAVGVRPVVERANVTVTALPTAVDLVAETQDALVVASATTASAFVLDPELELFVGASGVATRVLDLSSVEVSRYVVADTVQVVVGLHLVRSPGVAWLVAGSLYGDDGRGKNGEKRRELHVEVEAGWAEEM